MGVVVGRTLTAPIKTVRLARVAERETPAATCVCAGSVIVVIFYGLDYYESAVLFGRRREIVFLSYRGRTN